MELIILDTDVWSYLFKGDSRAQGYLEHLSGKLACVSFQTVAELRFWATYRNWGETRLRDLSEALEQFKVLHSDEATVNYWAEIRARRTQIGRPIAAQDAWIAASALRHNAALLTHNATDYAEIVGLRLIAVT